VRADSCKRELSGLALPKQVDKAVLLRDERFSLILKGKATAGLRIGALLPPLATGEKRRKDGKHIHLAMTGA